MQGSTGGGTSGLCIGSVLKALHDVLHTCHSSCRGRPPTCAVQDEHAVDPVLVLVGSVAAKSCIRVCCKGAASYRVVSKP